MTAESNILKQSDDATSLHLEEDMSLKIKSVVLFFKTNIQKGFETQCLFREFNYLLSTLYDLLVR